MALGSSQSVTELCTMGISKTVKAAGAYGRQPYHLHMPTVYKFCEPQLPGALRTYTGLNADTLLTILDFKRLMKAGFVLPVISVL